MATITDQQTYPAPQPSDPTTFCPACLSGTGPTDPNDPILKIAEPPAGVE